jgi:hypothetical protein
LPTFTSDDSAERLLAEDTTASYFAKSTRAVPEVADAQSGNTGWTALAATILEAIT